MAGLPPRGIQTLLTVKQAQTSLFARQALTIAELTRQIKVLLESELPPAWVSGEISNFKRHSSGHFYFSVKDEQAQIPCGMWAGRPRGLYFTPRDGLQVLVHEPGKPFLAAAWASYKDFQTINTTIVALSRQNSNVRSLTLSLGQKRKTTAECQDRLAVLQETVHKGMTYKATK